MQPQEPAAWLPFQGATCSPIQGSFPCTAPDLRAPFVAPTLSVACRGGSPGQLEELILQRGGPGRALAVCRGTTVPPALPALPRLARAHRVACLGELGSVPERSALAPCFWAVWQPAFPPWSPVVKRTWLLRLGSLSPRSPAGLGKVLELSVAPSARSPKDLLGEELELAQGTP